MRFSGALSGNTIDFGADNDSVTFSVGLTNNTIQGGGGADTFVFNTLVSSNYIYGGADGDTLRFSAGVRNNAIVSADAGADLLVFSSTVASAAAIYGGDDNDTLTFAGAVSFSTVNFGAGNDLATFSGAISSGQALFAGTGDDVVHFNNISIDETSVQGGLGHDKFSGGITVGSSGVSFWGGSGNDTFDFTTIGGNTLGTAYFWNDDALGVDSIVLGSVVSIDSSTTANANVVFAAGANVTTHISFSSSQELTSNIYTNMFAVEATGVTAVSAAVGTDMVTLTFGTPHTGTGAGGWTHGFGSFVLEGSNVEGITSAYSGFNSGSAVFGGGSTTIPTFS